VNDGQLSKFDRLRLQGVGIIYQNDGAYDAYLRALNPLRERYSEIMTSLALESINRAMDSIVQAVNVVVQTVVNAVTDVARIISQIAYYASSSQASGAQNSTDFNVTGHASQFGTGTLLRPGMVPALDAALRNDNFVNQLGVLYGLNKNYGVQADGGNVDVTEFFATLNGGSATSNRLYSNTITLSQDAFNSGGWTAFVTPSFTMTDLLAVAHTHPIEGVPSDGHDFSWQVPALSSRGVWSVVVTPSTIYFTGPQAGQYYYLPTSEFINAGKANNKTVTIPAMPQHGP